MHNAYGLQKTLQFSNEKVANLRAATTLQLTIRLYGGHCSYIELMMMLFFYKLC